MKRTIEMILMTLLLIFVAVFVGSTLMSCSSDDDENGGFIGKYKEVCGGEVYDDWGPEVDESDPLAAFFRDELHSPYWDGAGNEFKTFFEQGSWDNETCLMINSTQEFQAAYMGTKELPEVDFNQYTLVIGRTWSSDGSYVLDKTVLYNRDFTYELEAQFLHYLNCSFVCSIIRFYYWNLYPKLEPKEIILKRTVTDVYDLPES